ncbi:superoxide dismutase [Cu-Zn]-like isoform X4 [Chiloscyllium plagiosum]|uniref:superoxide dismutase [Cu-Zn]-like isoform X4 n=1 Tax=Chiloscyllium plagiosum TaxID=36176 RepID=UPI001CB7E0E0|nr:superoxide dismutase [Cu-Zn]-like isoform X4 [Chiloscyllium plagiosum]
MCEVSCLQWFRSRGGVVGCGRHGQRHLYPHRSLQYLRSGLLQDGHWISAGPHYNPDNEIHGAPEENNRHAGDLGNVEVNEDGLAKLEMEVQHFHLTGIHSILGRSLVIHQNEDDLGKVVLQMQIVKII